MEYTAVVDGAIIEKNGIDQVTIDFLEGKSIQV